MEIKTEKDKLEAILFELIVLSTDVPMEDRKTSASLICFLSDLPQDVSSFLIEAGGQLLGTAGGYEVWKNIYGAALMQNNKVELAEALNAEAEKQFN